MYKKAPNLENKIASTPQSELLLLLQMNSMALKSLEA